MSCMKYNYVIVGCGGYYSVGYHDVMSLDNVRYFSSMTEGVTSKLDLILQRITFSEQVNRFLSYPFASYTYSRLFPLQFKEDKPLVFLFFGNTQYLYQSTYLEYLRKQNPGVKFVLYLQDIVAINEKLNLEKFRKEFDLILSYDKGDCEKYGLVYHPTPYSIYPIPENPSIEPLDVFFCGKAKTRYRLIFDVYNRCKEKGLKCKFFITGVPDADRIISDDIVYDHPITYIENLQYVKKSKCILEVMQENADGYTPRLWESLVYDKHLLTNNRDLLNSCFNVDQSIHYFDKSSCKLSWIDVPVSHSLSFKESLSPKHLLQLVESKLDSKQ